jgi:hypothetical protein
MMMDRIKAEEVANVNNAGEEEELAARNAAYDRAVATHAKAAKLRRARMLKPHYRPTVEQLENYHIASRWPDLTPAAVGIKEDCLV